MNEVAEVLFRSREASEPAATSVPTAVLVATVADERPNRWGAR